MVGTAVVHLSILGRNGQIVPFATHNIMVSFYQGNRGNDITS